MNRARCPRCNTRLDHPFLIACQNCGFVFVQHEQSQLELLEQQRELLANEIAERVKHRLEHFEQEKNELVTEIAKRVPRLLRKQAVAVFLLILTIGGYGVWQAYNQIYSSVT